MVFQGVAPHAGARIETFAWTVSSRAMRVAPHAGARIETVWTMPAWQRWAVAPHAGARIETPPIVNVSILYWSLPIRERELKPAETSLFFPSVPVAPHAGARIETTASPITRWQTSVAPHAGARIETRSRQGG